MSFNFEKWDEKIAAISEPYVKFSEVQMYLPVALLKQMKEPYNLDLLVDLPNRAFCLHFHPGGAYKPNYVPGQIGVSRFVKENKPKIGVRLALKRYSNLAGLAGFGGICCVGSLDGKVIPV